jgi:hypothetical protein
MSELHWLTSSLPRARSVDELRAVAGMVHVGAYLIRDDNDDIPDEKRFVSDALVTTDDDGRTLDVAKASKLARQGVTFMRN